MAEILDNAKCRRCFRKCTLDKLKNGLCRSCYELVHGKLKINWARYL